MARTQSLPQRAQVKERDTWNLGTLFKSNAEWEKAFDQWGRQIAGFERFRGKLAESAKIIADCLKFDAQIDRTAERLSVYAFLKTAEDQGNSEYQRMKGRFEAMASKAGQAASYIRPEIMSIPAKRMEKFIAAPALKSWRLILERMLRYRPHTLGKAEEHLLALQSEMSESSNQIFRQLNDADLKWPVMKNERGIPIELGHSSYSAFLHSPKRAVRKEAFEKYYAEYDRHKNSLAAAYNGSVQRDVYYAKARHYPSALEASLFSDHVPVAVYDNLINSVHTHLPILYQYYELRRRLMKLKDIHQYDTYVPILSGIKTIYPWDKAVSTVVESLQPLGSEYVSGLERGLTSARWADRYPNQGKQSGAFSSGTFDGAPYILMNYQPEVLDHVFTLAHEAGHSMHSYYSASCQPYQYYSYVIFVAEVASTFNEQLLARHLMAKAKNDQERAYLINRMIDGIRATIIRQTMFAEFERITHQYVEAGEPLTVQLLREEYRKLLELYFGPDFILDPILELECLRIPHFYRAFYVYKYATGLSAAIALSKRVTEGGKQELSDYLSFLKGGCSHWPLDLLRSAGVDMQSPQPVDTALNYFGQLVSQLEQLLT